MLRENLPENLRTKSSLHNAKEIEIQEKNDSSFLDVDEINIKFRYIFGLFYFYTC